MGIAAEILLIGTHWNGSETLFIAHYLFLYYLRSVFLVKHGSTVDSSLFRSRSAAQFSRSNDETSHFDLHNNPMDLRCPFFAFAISGLGRLEIPNLSLRLGLFPTQCAGLFSWGMAGFSNRFARIPKR